MKRINKATFIDLLMIALGCAIYGISLDMISVPNKLADGGLSGISLILRHFWGINMGLSTLILNIPLILLGYRFMGKRLLAYKLMAKGVKKEDIEAAYETAGKNSAENAAALAAKKMKNKDVTKENVLKTYRYLVSRGFSYEEAERAVEPFRNGDD